MMKFYKYEILMNRFAYLHLKNIPELKDAFRMIQITDMRYDYRHQPLSHIWEYKVEMDGYAFRKIGTYIAYSAHIGPGAVITRGMKNDPILKENFTKFMANYAKQK